MIGMVSSEALVIHRYLELLFFKLLLFDSIGQQIKESSKLRSPKKNLGIRMAYANAIPEDGNPPSVFPGTISEPPQLST